MSGAATLPQGDATCLRCGAAMDPGDAFCRRCGSAAGAKIPWHHRRLPLLILIFAVIGPLGLGMLYRSPAFTRPQKVAVALLSFAELVAVGIMVNRLYHAALDQVMQQLGPYY